MCFFISAILPSSANIRVLARVMDRYGRALKPQSNPGLEAQLQPDERLLLTTAGHCDCGTALGALERKAALLERRLRSDERKEASLRRKGWGKSRIQRWRNQQRNVSSGHDPQAGLIDWERLLTDLLSQPRTPYVHGGETGLIQWPRPRSLGQVAERQLTQSFRGRAFH